MTSTISHTRRFEVLIVAITLLFAGLASASASANLPRHAVLGAGVAENNGVRVILIKPGSAADRGGLQVGDVIVSVDSVKIQTSSEFVSRVKGLTTRHSVDFQIRRGNAELSLPVKLDAAADENDPLVRTLYQTISVDQTLRRTLVTIPSQAYGRRPAVLILGGIGCFSIDNASDPQDSYMRLAHDLGKRGFVAMRLEKSGVGDSQGAPCITVDFQSEIHSYEVALEALQHDPHVDRRRIYLLGHSIGTLIAPRLANMRGAAGIIVAEGVGRNWIEYELSNLRRQLDLGGEPPAQVDAKLIAKEICMHRLLVEKEAETEIERTQPECREHNSYPASASYMQEVAALNIAEPWTKFSGPLLAIYGTGDFVTTHDDHRRIVDIVNTLHPGSATLMLIEGMDHHLDVAGTQQQAYDLRVKQQSSGPYDEALSHAVLDWLCQRENCIATVGSGATRNLISSGHE